MRNVSRQYHIQIDIYIRTRIYIIIKTAFKKPMNRLKGIFAISFPRINSWAAIMPFNRFLTNDHYLFLILSRHLYVGMLYEILFWTDMIFSKV